MDTNLVGSASVEDNSPYRSVNRSIRILWGLVVILLIVNVALLYSLNLARLAALDALDKVEATLDSLAHEVISYNVPVNKAVPLKAGIPLNQTVELPVSTTIPIDQEFEVPFSTSAGETNLTIPIKTDFPIDVVIPIDLNRTIEVDTVVQWDTTVPVEIDVAQTQLAGYLQQARRDVSNLRQRLALGSAPAPAVDNVGAAINADPPAAEAKESVAPDSNTGPQSRSEIAASPEDSADQTAASADVDLCTHAYWPLQPGATWTYNSSTSFFSQRVDSISPDGEVLLSTQFQEQDVRLNLTCAQDGLTGNYLGDMRRLTELGALEFMQSSGQFLPAPEIVESIGDSWFQEFQVTGAVQAQQGSRPVEGRISQGQAVATYTPTDIETVTTPLGVREAVRVEQQLELNLEVEYDLIDQAITVAENITLTNVYWFVQDVGLVKLHSQGGELQWEYQLDQAAITERATIPGLPEDLLVSACLMLEEEVLDCHRAAGVLEANPEVSDRSELDIPVLVFPDNLADATGARVPSATPPPVELTPTGASGATRPTPTEETDDEQAAMRAYAGAVTDLSQQLSGIASPFAQSALQYRDDPTQLDQLRSDFNVFRSQARDLIAQARDLSPPPAATRMHGKLTAGLAKCDQAIDLMDAWLNTLNSSDKDSAALLAAACIQEVEEAQEEMADLLANSNQ